MTDSDNSDDNKSLAEILLEHKLLHKAQIDLAVSDQELNDIPLEEILLVRGWITQEKLYEVAPWLKTGSSKSRTGNTGQHTKPAAKPAAKAAADKPSAGDAPQSKPAPKPEDLPKQPPLISTASPPMLESPISVNPEQALKAYKEVLRKILSDKE